MLLVLSADLETTMFSLQHYIYKLIDELVNLSEYLNVCQTCKMNIRSQASQISSFVSTPFWVAMDATFVRALQHYLRI